MINYPLVSVNIPTRNSSKTLSSCIESIKKQTYPNIEIIVIDSNSTDNTLDIAKSYSTEIISTNWKLLGARYLGAKASKGEYILLLDSDQILYPSTVERLIAQTQKFDMICLEETAYNPQTLLERLFVADRNLVNRLANMHINPLEGVMLARFYKKSVLLSAFENISIDKLHDVVAHDHAIIYYEAYQISKKVTVLPKAVMHKEPSTITELWCKNYRYGRTTRELLDANLYTQLLKRKTRFRRGSSIMDKESLQSFLLLILKGVPYILGLKFGGSSSSNDQIKTKISKQVEQSSENKIATENTANQ
jgi:glycosyltransferase involved in cell wall biosynthesis